MNLRRPINWAPIIYETVQIALLFIAAKIFAGMGYWDAMWFTVFVAWAINIVRR